MAETMTSGSYPVSEHSSSNFETISQVARDFVYRIEAASTEKVTSEARAHELESEAERLRSTSDTAWQTTFRDTVSDLMKKHEAGELSTKEVAAIVSSMNEHDPRFSSSHPEYSTSRILETLDAIQPGAPMVEIGSRTSGIITSDPRVTLTPAGRRSALETPLAEVGYDIRHVSTASSMEAGKIEFETKHMSTRLTKLGDLAIGADQIQARIDSLSSSAIDSKKLSTAMATEIHQLRDQIDALYELGMDKVKTDRLDQILKELEASDPSAYSKRTSTTISALKRMIADNTSKDATWRHKVPAGVTHAFDKVHDTVETAASTFGRTISGSGSSHPSSH